MIAMTLEEIAGIVGGRLVDAAPSDRRQGTSVPGQPDPRAGRSLRRLRGRARGRTRLRRGGGRGRCRCCPRHASDRCPHRAGGRRPGRAAGARARTCSSDCVRSGIRLRVLAITGSQGKTTAKDMLARVLADAGATVATAGSFNNELGLPLTVLRADRKTWYLVLEMGSRGVGHLAELCAIAPPDISLVLNVGKAHIGEFGSREQIAVAKGELVEALQPDGAAVLNLDDPLVAMMAIRTQAHVWTFGHSAAAAVRIADVQVDDLGRASFDLTHRGKTEHIALRLLGEHQAVNAAATTAAALAAGLTLETGRREPARGRPSLSHADGAARARRRARRHQRRLQRQPGLDAVRAGDPRAHRPLRQADGRRAGGDARARRHRGGGAPAGRAAPRAARHRRGRGRRGGRPRGVRRARRRRGHGHDALRRDRHRGRGVVARECGRSRRRTRQGVAFGATRDGGRHARRRPG